MAKSAIARRSGQTKSEQLGFSSHPIYEKIEKGPFTEQEQLLVRLFLISKGLNGFEARTTSAINECLHDIRGMNRPIESQLDQLVEAIGKTSELLNRQFRTEINTAARLLGVSEQRLTTLDDWLIENETDL